MNNQNVNFKINQDICLIDNLITDELTRKAAKLFAHLVVERENHCNWDECIVAVENEISMLGGSKAYGNLTRTVIMTEVNQFNRDFLKDTRYKLKINKG